MVYKYQPFGHGNLIDKEGKQGDAALEQRGRDSHFSSIFGEAACFDEFGHSAGVSQEGKINGCVAGLLEEKEQGIPVLF